VPHNLTYSGAVVVLEPASEGVRHQFFCDCPRELFRFGQQQRPQSRQTCDLLTTWSCSAGIDRLARLVNRTPTANDIEMLQRKPKGIDRRMTTIASRTRSMLREALAYGFRWGARLFISQIRIHARRWRRHGQAEDIVQKILAAQYRRSAIRIRRRDKQR